MGTGDGDRVPLPPLHPGVSARPAEPLFARSHGAVSRKHLLATEKFVAAAHRSPALLAALLLGEAKDAGMEIIHDVLCNQHGDLLGHRYYCIRLHFSEYLFTWSAHCHGLAGNVLAGRAEPLPGQSPVATEPGAAAEGPTESQNSRG